MNPKVNEPDMSCFEKKVTEPESIHALGSSGSGDTTQTFPVQCDSYNSGSPDPNQGGEGD